MSARFNFNHLQPLRQSSLPHPLPPIPQTILSIDGTLSWYFFSVIKNRILRRKRQNSSLAKVATWLMCRSEKLQVAAVLVSFHQAGTLTVDLLNQQKALRWVRGGNTCKNYILVLLKGNEYISEGLIRGYWTQHYCLCERLITSQTKDTSELTQSTKQQVADMALALSVLYGVKEKVKEMSLLFLRDGKGRPVLVAVYAVEYVGEEGERKEVRNNYRLKEVRSLQPCNDFQMDQKTSDFRVIDFNQVHSTQQTRNLLLDYQPSLPKSYRKAFNPNPPPEPPAPLNCYQCSTCRNVFPQPTAKYITKNRIHSLQIRSKIKTNLKQLDNQRVIDGQLRPSLNRRLFLKKYDEVAVCPSCYEVFVRQVGETEKQYKEYESRHESKQERSVAGSSVRGYFVRAVSGHQRTKSSSRSKQIRTRTSITRQELENQADTSTISKHQYTRAGRTQSTKCNIGRL